MGRPSTLSYPEASVDARALQRPSAGLIKLLLEMPDTHYKYSHHPAPPRTQTYLPDVISNSRIPSLLVQKASLVTNRWLEGVAISDFWN